MEGIARGDVEILVHTSAPSRGQDDVRYRALARACLDFVPATRRELDDNLPNDPLNISDRQEDCRLQPELLQSAQEEDESAASYHPGGESSNSSEQIMTPQVGDPGRVSLSQLFESPNVSFNGAVDSIDSPVFRGLVMSQSKAPNESHGKTQVFDSADSWAPPPSVVADSQPESNSLMPTHSSPSKVLELHVQHFQSSKERTSSSVSGLGQEETNKSGLHLPIPSQGNVAVSPGRKRLPSSPPRALRSPQPTSGPERPLLRVLRSRKHNSAFTKDEAVPLSRPRSKPICADGDNSSSAPAKGALDSSIPTPCRSTQSRKRKLVEEGSRVQKAEITAVKHKPSQHSFTEASSECLEVRPPPPPTSTMALTPSCLVTNSLLGLAQTMPLGSIFRPHNQIRKLRPMERGHWLLNCQPWDADLQRRSWDYLRTYVGKGAAGWGVWCIREEDFGSLRIYCWGEVVGHIYLLLYIASESKVRESETFWIGGDGEAVVRMQP